MPIPSRLLFVLLILAATLASSRQPNAAAAPRGEATVTPGSPIDFEPLAFYPDRWKKRNVPLTMTPWVGEHLVFLTTDSDYDPKVMAGLLKRLDRGWTHYAELTGRQPRLFKQVNGLPTIAAVPGSELTCGYGCGYVGSTGIELSAFYATDYGNIKKDPSRIPDYYFYEMGRNYYTFGDRHSQYTTGFAVFMRYVMVDHCQLTGGESLRKTIESAEAIHAKSDLSFLHSFTNHGGLAEKGDRLKDENGKTIRPSDINVMYASAMLRLRREFGGDEWVKRFYHQLAKLPEIKAVDKETARKQGLLWLLAASAAAQQDLTSIFVDEWRLPMSDDERKAFGRVKWKSPRVDAAKALAQIQQQLQS